MSNWRKIRKIFQNLIKRAGLNKAEQDGIFLKNKLASMLSYSDPKSKYIDKRKWLDHKDNKLEER